MTLSSSEAEQTSLLEAVKEVILSVKLLQSMKISVKLPAMLVENVGTIFILGSSPVTIVYYRA